MSDQSNNTPSETNNAHPMPENNGPPPPEPPDLDGTVDPGGSSSSFTFGGGGSSGGDPLAGFRSALLRLRIPPGPFIGLMQEAANQNWTSDEFLHALETDDRFQRMFPGLSSLFDQGLVGSIPEAVAYWRRLAGQYQQVMDDTPGAGRLPNLNPRTIGYLISHGIDQAEWAFRLNIEMLARRSEQWRQSFNRILKSRNERQLDELGWRKFLAGKENARLYDLWEGAALLNELGDQGLKTRQARMLAKSVAGEEGGVAFDPAGFATAVNSIYDTLGPQALKDAGISTADVALAALSERVTSPERAKKAAGIASALDQMLRNQQAASRADDGVGTALVNGRPVSSSAPS